jgi:hypothetical protein
MRRPAWIGIVCALTAAAAGAQQVTLPLPQYEELRSRANPEVETPPVPPAPYALESADFEIAAGASSARITQTLALTIYGDGWQRVPLGEAGSFTTARFGDLEGRVEVKDDGWALQVKGRGRHEVKLESVVPVRRDETAIRPAWSFTLRFPPAAVVRGRMQAPPEVEEVEMSGAGMIRKEDRRTEGAGWSFVAAFAKAGDPGAGFTLYGRRTLPPRAQLPLRFEATAATSVMITHTQLRVHGWIEARVAQGRLEALRVPVPAGLSVVSVTGGPLAGWNVQDGVLIVTPLAPVESSLALDVQLAGDPPKAFASPLLVPEGSRRTLFLTKAALQGDGLLNRTEPGAVRAPETIETEALPAGLRNAAGRLLTVLDPARPPRWEVEWAERTEVLAAQVDRLLVDVMVGASGRAAYQVWAEVRNRGAQQLGINLPAGFELVSAGRDGVPVAVGSMGGSGGLAVPLQTGEATQVVHLAGLLPMALPAGNSGNADFAVPLPALSAPAARVEVCLILPGERPATLADPSRAGAVKPPPEPVARREAANVNAIAKQVLANTRTALAGAGFGLFFRPPGFAEISASWNALSANPLPLVVRLKTEKESPSWF